MKFCKQPNGKFIEYDDFMREVYETNMDKRQLLKKIISEYVSSILDSYFYALESDSAIFDNILTFKPAHEDGTLSRQKWLDIFKECGANDEQMKEVEAGIEEHIQESKEILEEVQAETDLEPIDLEGIKKLKKEIVSLEAKR